MAQRVKTSAAKPGDLGAILRTHMVEGERDLMSASSYLPYRYHGVCDQTYT